MIKNMKNIKNKANDVGVINHGREQTKKNEDIVDFHPKIDVGRC
jgi:hypothetical protein